jgi:sugar/nucleoside kinase (ribokinase family)
MCVDVVLSGNIRPQFNQVEQIIDNYVLELGGSANIFASQLVKLGGRAGVIGRIGHDAFGKFTLERLRSIGVDTSRVSCHPSLKTGLGVALAETRDRAILTYLGTIDAVLPADLPDNLPAACRHWHIASFFLLGSLRPYWSHWVQRCKEAGLSTSLDTNWDPQNRWDGVTELLPFIDVFLPNEAEALSLTGETDLLKAGKRLAGRGPLVVVKRGDRGATAFKGNKTWHVHPSDFPAVPTVLVDSVGAGDNFDAGFMRAWLLGRDVDECLGWAHRCAVASLASPGGIQGQLCELVR